MTWGSRMIEYQWSIWSSVCNRYTTLNSRVGIEHVQISAWEWTTISALFRDSSLALVFESAILYPTLTPSIVLSCIGYLAVPGYPVLHQCTYFEKLGAAGYFYFWKCISGKPAPNQEELDRPKNCSKPDPHYRNLFAAGKEHSQSYTYYCKMLPTCFECTQR